MRKMEKENLAKVACDSLHLPCPEPDLKDWTDMVEALRNPIQEVNISLVGKYTQLHDAYISVVEALKHGGIAERATVNLNWVDSELLNDENVYEQIAIIGGGVIGIEFAFLYASLGKRVIILEALDRILANMDKEFALLQEAALLAFRQEYPNREHFLKK